MSRLHNYREDKLVHHFFAIWSSGTLISPPPGSSSLQGAGSVPRSWLTLLSIKSERIQKRILRFFTEYINPRSLGHVGSWCVKGTEESTLDKDSSVPLMRSESVFGFFRI